MKKMIVAVALSVMGVSSAFADDAKSMYQASCFACHGTGYAAAPQFGDKAAWKARIAQGNDTLYKHAIEGFTGKTGVMPPKGGSQLSDADVKKVVDYMVANSK